MRYVFLLLFLVACNTDPEIMSVSGWVEPDEVGIALPHEHLLVDFIGADSITADRYDADSVFNRALPFLLEIKSLGCKTFFDCTPQYLGRDVRLLRRLAAATGINIITNTGYYGAAGEKYVPAFAYVESTEEIAGEWISEWTDGIDGTDIKPGFMKLAADRGPLTAMQKTLVEAAAITHLATGLTIAMHAGNGASAREALDILTAGGVAPEAFVWVHAQNEADATIFSDLARKGVWISFDGVNMQRLDACITFLKFMKGENLLHRVLLSHDAGWYHVGEPGGGEFRGYTVLLQTLLPRLQSEDFTPQEIELIAQKNPALAFGVEVRVLK